MTACFIKGHRSFCTSTKNTSYDIGVLILWFDSRIFLGKREGNRKKLFSCRFLAHKMTVFLWVNSQGSKFDFSKSTFDPRPHKQNFGSPIHKQMHWHTKKSSHRKICCHIHSATIWFQLWTNTKVLLLGKYYLPNTTSASISDQRNALNFFWLSFSQLAALTILPEIL
jgi:hypothetical protein